MTQEGHSMEQHSPCNALFTILNVANQPWCRPKKIYFDIVDNRRHNRDCVDNCKEDYCEGKRSFKRYRESREV